MKRLGHVQAAVLTLLSMGVREFNEIVRMLTSMSIPKSSIYTAVDELRRRGVIDIKVIGERKFIKPKIDIEKEVSRIRMMLRDKSLEIAYFLINMLRSDIIDFELLEPPLLEELRDALRETLDKVEKVLKGWRHVVVK